MTFIQPPLLGALLSNEGNKANKLNGKANATAKPSMPIIGAIIPPVVATSTNKKPMIGPVHEKLTNESVKAIKKMLKKPVVASALLSTARVHLEGNVISKPPKKLAPKTTSIKKNKMLNTAFVERSLSALGPQMLVTMRPKPT